MRPFKIPRILMCYNLFMKNKAFSLIELLVVVAIIGILASVAAPIYSRYTLTAQASSIVPIVDYLINLSYKKQQLSGSFANASDMNLASAAGQQYADQAAAVALNKYILASGTSIMATDWAQQAGGGWCPGKYGMIRVNLDPTKLNLPSNYTFFQIECDLWNYNKTLFKFCWYTYGGSGFVGTGSPIPSWLAATDTSSSNVVTARNAMVSYQNMSCP